MHPICELLRSLVQVLLNPLLQQQGAATPTPARKKQTSLGSGVVCTMILLSKVRIAGSIRARHAVVCSVCGICNCKYVRPCSTSRPLEPVAKPSMIYRGIAALERRSGRLCGMTLEKLTAGQIGMPWHRLKMPEPTRPANLLQGTSVFSFFPIVHALSQQMGAIPVLVSALFPVTEQHWDVTCLHSNPGSPDDKVSPS